MMIGRIDSVNALNNVQNTRKTQETKNVYDVNDSISLSDEARAAAEELYLKQVADETPDVRSDLVASIKEKIKDPNYLNPERISATADMILTSYGF